MFAKYYENPTMLSRVIAKNVGDVFFETQCILKSCSHNARLVTYEIQNKNTANTNTHVGTEYK